MGLKQIRQTSKAEARRQALAAAMPEVQALCKKHGRAVVMSCVTRIAQYEKKAAEVEKLRRQAAALEKKLMLDSANVAHNVVG